MQMVIYLALDLQSGNIQFASPKPQLLEREILA